MTHVSSLAPTLFDYAVIATVSISCILGVLRGGLRELLGLTSWIIAFVAAQALGGLAAPLLPPTFGTPAVRAVVAFVGVFLLTLLAVGIASTILVTMLRRAGLGTADRLLGLGIGLLRGLLVCVVAVMIAGLTSIPKFPEWRNAISSRWFEAIVEEIKPYLPDGVARRINYNQTRV